MPSDSMTRATGETPVPQTWTNAKLAAALLRWADDARPDESAVMRESAARLSALEGEIAESRETARIWIDIATERGRDRAALEGEVERLTHALRHYAKSPVYGDIARNALRGASSGGTAT